MFLLFTLVAVIAAVIHNVAPGPHHLRYSAFIVALFGSWFGGYCAAAFVQRTFITMGWVTLVGSVVSAALHVAAFELIARAFVRHPHHQDLL